MWKVKEFEHTSTKLHEIVNEFVKSNGIKDYEVVGYQVNWSENYEDHCSHILIKYWEEQ
ncbi:hypothetical protein RJB92_01300 [Staphylococcus hominis]|uniref:hypothetical protein n=1 Tax=Staphylococcus hominis TaxID=1290 RepID=UPI00287947BE|nr:hypothetical protein [Staphylococcus hominis]MDS3866871.1 hypothetical protein [Staphylococcus hominis]